MHVFAVLFLAATLRAASAGDLITFPQTSDSERIVPENSLKEELEASQLKGIANHIGTLGLKTLRELNGANSNVIISPFNVHSCLGILHLGAAGNTKEEIRRVLGPVTENLTVSDIVTPNEGVSYASVMFLDRSFVPRKKFLEAAEAKFEASVLNMDASDREKTKEAINNWVSNHTNGTITRLLRNPLDRSTKMVIVSALLFKGRWLHSFPAAATFKGMFQTENSSVEVPFMHLEATVPLVQNSHFDAISLPYIDTHGMTMHVILPKAHGAVAIKKLLSQLNIESLKDLRKKSVEKLIVIRMPKLKIEGRFSLRDPLKKQGISDMFNPSRVNFSELATNSSGLYVSEIYHSVHFEMDEEGTTASAATFAVFTKSRKFEFRANRPFIFVITDESDVILFMGVIMNPVP